MTDRITKTCPTCGADFVPVSNSQDYCGKPCARLAATARERERWRATHPEPQRKACPFCGAEFTAYRPQQVYCTVACRKRAGRAPAKAVSTPRRETAAIVPSERKVARTKPMTDAEFDVYYEAERRRLIEAGRPLFDPGWRDRMAATSQAGFPKRDTRKAA